MESPLSACRYMVSELRHYLRGGNVSFRDEKLDLPSEAFQRVKTGIGAHGPKMVATGVEFCDALITPRLDKKFEEYFFPTVEDNFRKFGRSWNDFELIMPVNMAIGRSKDEAKALLKPMVAESLGHLPDTAGKVMNLPTEERMRIKYDPGLLPDQLLDQLAVAGTAEDVARELERLASLGASQVYLWLPVSSVERNDVSGQIERRLMIMKTVAEHLL